MQSKKKSLKQKIIAIFTIIALFAMTLSVFAFAQVGGVSAAALDEEAFTRESISVTNGDFTNAGSGDAVNDPSSWSAEGNSSSGSTVHGVIDLDTQSFLNEDNLKDYKLEDVEEFKDIQGNFGGNLTPFGVNTKKFPDTDTNALFINSDVADAYYGYNSASLSLSANSYYEISAWVKTSDFGGNQGATVKVTGMENPLAFKNINTVSFNGDDKNDESNDYGWVKYSFYIETSTMHGSTVNIGLELGNYLVYTDGSGESVDYGPHKARGYVFFDNVTAFELSADQFAKEVAEKTIVNEKSFDIESRDNRNYYTNDGGNVLLYSENDSDFLSIGDDGKILRSSDAGYSENEIGSFDNEANGWTQIIGSQSIKIGQFNGPSEEDLGITDMRPFSPDGENNNIAVLSNYRTAKEAFDSSVIGYTTKPFTVPKNTNYRLSVWVNACGGSVASAALYGEDYRGNATTGPNAGSPQNRLAGELTEGDGNNKSHNGWKEVAFYLKGSFYTDYSVSFEIWLGRKAINNNNEMGYSTENVSGVAMFDNIRIEEISNEEFNSYSSSTSTFNYDHASDTNDIANYKFDDFVSSNDGALPSPMSWTFMTAGEDGTTGMSNNVVNEDYNDVVHTGVVSSNDVSYTFVRKNDNDKTQKTFDINTRYPQNEYSRLLMIRSDGVTGNKDGIAVGYKSSAFSVSSDKVHKVEVTMLTENIEGYGANVVLKNGSNILATVERIQNTNGYKTYTIYIDPLGKSLSNLSVEIWLGLYDKFDNTSKLSKGTIFVDKAEVSEADDINVADSQSNYDNDDTRENVKAKINEYESKFGSDGSPDFAIYSASDSAFNMFDHNDDSFLKAPYNWTLSTNNAEGTDAVAYGIFNGSEENSALFPDGYTQGKRIVDKNGTEEDANIYSLAIINKSPAMSRVTGTYNYRLESAAYYIITVYAKVDIPFSQKADRPDYKGAYIGIDGTDYFCSDIKNSATVTDFYAPETDVGDNFRKFTIYVHTAGDEDSEDMVSVNLSFGIGGSARGERAVGSLIINGVTVTKGTVGAFEEAMAELESGNSLSQKYSVIADYAATQDNDDEDTDEGDTPDEQTPNTGDNWYVYISIILAVVVLIAIVAFAVRYFAKKRKKDYSDPNIKVSYDRAKTLAKQVRAREEIGDIEEYLNNSYDRFDEDEEDRFEAMKAAEEIEKSDVKATETTTAEADETAENSENVAETAETTDENVSENAEPVGNASGEQTEPVESDNAVEGEAVVESEEAKDDEEYKYDEEIVDFTPSEEQKRILAERKAEAEKVKAEKEAEELRKEQERAKLEAERKAATRRNNNWDDFED